jgi:uncharacterized protein (TIGR03437 family)
MDGSFRRIDRGGIGTAVRIFAVAVAFAFSPGKAGAQLVTDVNAIPNTGKPPVVFVNGYQRTCGGTSFAGTFGMADRILQTDNRASLFFDSCRLANHPPIEDLGNALGGFLGSLRYQTGEAVPQVDIVAHSMGGLIVRSYLAGKQTQAGVFTPPADTKIRKIVFLGTPHFGSPATSLLGGVVGGGDAQTDELQVGSAFVFDLATWNQGIDDLRGIDAISVLGNVSNGALLMNARFGDGVTTLTSGSLGFVAPERTQVIPYCHTDIASLLCLNSKGNLADINSTDHQSAQIILSFLGGTAAWKTIGEPAAKNEFLSKNGGLLLRLKDASDKTLPIAKATTAQGDLTVASQIAFADQLTVGTQPLQLTLTSGSSTTIGNVPLTVGATRAITFKPGPSIAGVFPSAAAVFPRTVAPGSLISIYGSELTVGSRQPEVNVAGQPMPLSYAAATQINSLVPDNASGLIKLQVKSAIGEQTVNILVEPTVPAIFAPALNAITSALVTPQAPLHPGDYVSLYLTGLGQTHQDAGLNWANVQPQVTFGGQPCIVSFAGRAPGFPGLDQINCQISMAVTPSDTAQVIVRSGARVSNVTTLPVR